MWTISFCFIAEGHDCWDWRCLAWLWVYEHEGWWRIHSLRPTLLSFRPTANTLSSFVSTWTHVSHLMTLPCDLWGHWIIEVTATFLLKPHEQIHPRFCATRLSYYTDEKNFCAPPLWSILSFFCCVYTYNFCQTCNCVSLPFFLFGDTQQTTWSQTF